MTLEEIKAVYFVGAGGIGMSALVRYFVRRGVAVAGYDKTSTPLTEQLEKEGVLLHYEESVEQIPSFCLEKATTLVVYTPAIPDDHEELKYFRAHGFEIQKRAQLLGTLTRSNKGLCVAGTHGKTSTSTMCAHIMHQSRQGCNAFLGGISKNYNTNYILSDDSRYVVIEADEFDRSFHWLSPWISVITSTDPDHLDVYGTEEAYLESFGHYTSLIQPNGALIVHQGLKLKPAVQAGVRVYEYSREAGDFHAENIRIDNGKILFDFVSPKGVVHDVCLGHPIPVNIDNAIAAMAMAQLAGCTDEELSAGIGSYLGVERRFDFKVNTARHVLLSDYAHHPKEILESAKSMRQLYRHRKITAMFQPHLYTRTRDFYLEFAQALSLFDEVLLCEIYPAREVPIEGVTSSLIYEHLADGVQKELIKKDEALNIVGSRDFDVLIVLGAGDLDNLVPQMAELMSAK